VISWPKSIKPDKTPHPGIDFQGVLRTPSGKADRVCNEWFDGEGTRRLPPVNSFPSQTPPVGIFTERLFRKVGSWNFFARGIPVFFQIVAKSQRS
jgi:hypothetical protein